jgi:hypothetical protein
MKGHLINLNEIHFKLNRMQELYLFYLGIFVLNIRTWIVLHFSMITDLPKDIVLWMWLEHTLETVAETK